MVVIDHIDNVASGSDFTFFPSIIPRKEESLTGVETQIPLSVTCSSRTKINNFVGYPKGAPADPLEGPQLNKNVTRMSPEQAKTYQKTVNPIVGAARG